MSRASALLLVHGGDVGLVCGISWLPGESVEAWRVADGLDGVARGLMRTAKDLELDFAFVPSEEPWAARAVELLREADVASFWVVSGLLGRVADRLGWLETLRLTAARPDALTGPLDDALADAIGAIDDGLAAGADAIIVADDLSGARGPLVSPDFALDALLPRYRALVTRALVGHVPALFHSDGDIRALIPALRREGFAATHAGSLDPAVLPALLAAVRSAGMGVLGGISAARLPDHAREMGQAAGVLAPGGGFAVCDDGGMTAASDIARYAQALDAAREAYGREQP